MFNKAIFAVESTQFRIAQINFFSQNFIILNFWCFKKKIHKNLFF